MPPDDRTVGGHATCGVGVRDRVERSQCPRTRRDRERPKEDRSRPECRPLPNDSLNMAKHRKSPHLAFWKVLKGHDPFEVTRKEPRVAVCAKQYVFDAQSSGKFNPMAMPFV
jgi:hypothetical protein